MDPDKDEFKPGKAWDKWKGAAEKGPGAIVLRVIFFVAIFSIVAAVLFGVVGTCGEAVDVAKKEFGPKALLKKYEWFKDMSASLDAKLATIDRFGTKIKQLKNDYADTHRKDWPRDDREQLSKWQSELDGIAATYNKFSSEYNSQMSKFNWRFCNKGDLPKGADVPLPREYKPYINE
jgi:hypothetical protein